MKSRNENNSECREFEFPENPVGMPHPLDSYKLVREWLEGKPNATSLVPPYDPTWAAAIEQRDSHPVTPLSAQERDELSAFNLGYGNVAGAALVPALGEKDTLVVVTGQQPNLLVSPLFILVKAVATVALAEEISRVTGRRVVPLFWVASDDHDFTELAQCYILGRSGALRNLAVLVVRHGAFSEASPAYAWQLDPVAPHLAAALRGELPSGGARSATIDAVDKALASPATFESVFCRLLAHYLEHSPIIFVAPHLRFLRERQRLLVEQEIELGEQTNKAVAEGAKLLSSHGYKPQIHRQAHVFNFFYMVDGVRCRLVQKGRRILVEHPGKKTVLTELPSADLLAHARRHWMNFSPNVVMRPIVQDAVFPTIAYVAGPAEFTYLAQIRSVYELFDVCPSNPILRPMVTLLSTGARVTLQRLGAWETFLHDGLGGVVEKIVEGEEKLGETLRRLRQHEDTLQMELATLGNALTGSFPDLAIAFEKTRHHVASGLRKLRQRILRQFRPSSWDLCRDLCSVFTEIAPMASPQERVLSPLSFGYEIEPQGLTLLLREALVKWRPSLNPLILALGSGNRSNSLQAKAAGLKKTPLSSIDKE
jgi:bacillithiol biosynthesis cysteine-adding enzyme BshC